MTKPYRPSNSSDGMFFESICAECKHDRAYQRGEGDSCPIVANLYALGQVPEWIVDDNGWSNPRCTAFEKAIPEGTTPRCDKTIDMFEGK